MIGRVVLIFLQLPFRGQKLLRKLCFCLEATKAKIPTGTFLKEEISMGQAGTLCSLRRENQSTTSLCIVVGSPCFDFWLSP